MMGRDEPSGSVTVVGFSTACEPWAAMVSMSSGDRTFGDETPVDLWLGDSTGERPGAMLESAALVAPPTAVSTDGAAPLSLLPQPATTGMAKSQNPVLCRMVDLLCAW